MTDNNPPRNLNEATPTEKALSGYLIALAGTVFAGAVAFWVALLSFVNETGDTLVNIIIVAILASTILSIIFGGRGFASGPKHSGFWDRFNLQAMTGLLAVIGIICLGLVIYFFGEPSKLDDIDNRQAVLGSQVTDISSRIDKVKDEISALRVRLGNISRSVDKMGKIQKEHGEYLRNLGDKIDKIEQ